jgi:hypothetical protein
MTPKIEHLEDMLGAWIELGPPGGSKAWYDMGRALSAFITALGRAQQIPSGEEMKLLGAIQKELARNGY